MSLDKNRPQNEKEELLNGISHAFGILFTLGIMYFLLMKSYKESILSYYSVLSFIFGMLMVYTCSTSYHLAKKVRLNPDSSIGFVARSYNGNKYGRNRRFLHGNVMNYIEYKNRVQLT